MPSVSLVLRGRSVLREASVLPALTVELATQDRLELLVILGLLAPSDKWVRRDSLAPSVRLVLWVLRAELVRLERKARLVSPVSLERLVLPESLATTAAWVRLA